jgi:uncharacterized membrane protein YoaK (UPF0700 family)
VLTTTLTVLVPVLFVVCSATSRYRAGVTFPCVVSFVAGCAAGAVLEVDCGLWALALPVVLAVAAVPLGEIWDQ